LQALSKHSTVLHKVHGIQATQYYLKQPIMLPALQYSFFGIVLRSGNCFAVEDYQRFATHPASSVPEIANQIFNN